jgi:hypothetical protein
VIALLVGAALQPAHATICTTNRTGDIGCGDVVSETLDERVSGGAWVPDDPANFSTYTCARVVPGGGTYTQSGPEHIWHFTCPATGPVTVELSGLSCDMDLFLLSPCSAGSCVVASIRSSRSNESFTFTCTVGLDYEIVPEAYQLGLNPNSCPLENLAGVWYAHSPYDLSVTCDEICGNGNDDDGDGLQDCEEVLCAGTAACCDADGDGFDAPSCGGDDCDDADPDTHPGALEQVADGLDQDCDGADDCWLDEDGDAWGGSLTGAGVDLSCDDPGLVARTGDCADRGPGAASIYPGAPDAPGDGVDADCDGAERCPVDLDGDGHGGPQVAPGVGLICGDDPGEAAIADDCDDANPARFPGAAETCDGVDNDCDALVDDADPDLPATATWYLDLDGDGWGAGPGSNDCARPPLTVVRPGDCDDLDPQIAPSAAETCDGVDNDCDALVDDADPDLPATATWYLDLDGDGWGAGPGSNDCAQPPLTVVRPGDCDDLDPQIAPSADEVCNGVDDDCDLLVDEAPPGAPPWYPDEDGDGWGVAALPEPATLCPPPDDRSTTPGDCDDTRAERAPSRVEVPYDDVDQDCDGADLDDLDGDGAAGGPTGADCHDGDPAVLPGAPEQPNGGDDDCDGRVDEGTERYDDDGDGFAELGGDCDDAAVRTHPGAVEACDGVDEDCDGRADQGTVCADDDGDGFSELEGDCQDADPTISPVAVDPPYDGVDRDCDDASDGADLDGDGVAGWAGDCDDADATARPGAIESPNGRDDDCDGAVDEGLPGTDDDGDGFTELAGDCHDGNPDIHPGADEILPGVDDDCDGAVDEGSRLTDDDGDGFSEAQGDCADADPSVRPGADEVRPGVDDDCDGVIDPLEDQDEDGWTVAAGDCDDGEGWTHPEAPEILDGADNDCDGATDETPDDDAGAVPPSSDGGCGCAHLPASPAPAGALALAFALAARRRR